MEISSNSVYKNLENELFEVVKVVGEDDVYVRFVDTGYECRTRLNLVKEGSVRDFTKLDQERSLWIPYEEEFLTNSGSRFRSFSKNGQKIRVVFEKTGHTTEVYLSNARAGKVKDPYEISVYGQGFIGTPDKTLPYWRQALQLWQNMLKRCYSEKDLRGYYGKCFVDDRWKSFENFLNDLKYLKGFDEWVKGSKNSFYKANLDKDFYKQGNDTYSRHYCRFLPQGYNKSLGKKGKTKGDWA